MSPGDDFDELAQRLVIALRDHADEMRAMPDLDAMRELVQAAVSGPPPGSGARRSSRVLAAAACSLLVLGGLGLVTATGNRSDAAPTVVEDRSLTAAARVAAPSSTATPTGSLVPVGSTAAAFDPASDMVTTVVPPAPTTIAAPPAPALNLAAVSNDLQAAPTTTTTAAPRVTAPPTTAPVWDPPKDPAPTTSAKPPKTTTTKGPGTTTTLSPYAFTLQQKWRSSSASPPFEELWGTAKPGATITVTSPYGGGTTVVGPSGAWALRVEFPSAPLDTRFTGTVKTAQGQKSFTFKRVAA